MYCIPTGVASTLAYVPCLPFSTTPNPVLGRTVNSVNIFKAIIAVPAFNEKMSARSAVVDITIPRTTPTLPKYDASKDNSAQAPYTSKQHACASSTHRRARAHGKKRAGSYISNASLDASRNTPCVKYQLISTVSSSSSSKPGMEMPYPQQHPPP